MKKRITIKWSILLMIPFFLISCSSDLDDALVLSGNNRGELEKTLDYYKKNSKDGLKYKAAVFLIKNMPNHSYRKVVKAFDPAFDSIQNYPIGIEIGLENPNATEEQLRAIIVTKIDNGEMIIIESDKLVKSNGDQINNISEIKGYQDAFDIGQAVQADPDLQKTSDY